MQIKSVLNEVLVPVNKAGHPFIGAFAAFTFIFFLLSQPLGWIGVVLTLWCVYFFRDPVRVTPTREDLVISPADGRVLHVTKALPPKEIWEKDENGNPIEPKALLRIAIFMNVFDVHVNRVPVAGRIKNVVYHEGKYFNADLDKASEENERNTLVMEDPKGREVIFTQIAGLVARRILCFKKTDDNLTVGQRYGLIRFGSRVDVFLPEGAVPMVIPGQKTLAGETVIADFDCQETEARQGTAD